MNKAAGLLLSLVLVAPSSGEARPKAPTVGKPKPGTAWSVTRTVSPIDDSVDVHASATAALTDEELRAYGLDSKPALVLRCQEGHTDAFVSLGFPADINMPVIDGVPVTIRWDKEKAYEAITTRSNDGQAIFLPEPIGFMRAIGDHRTLLIRVSPLGRTPVILTWDLDGGSEAFTAVRDACASNIVVTLISAVGERPGFNAAEAVKQLAAANPAIERCYTDVGYRLPVGGRTSLRVRLGLQAAVFVMDVHVLDEPQGSDRAARCIHDVLSGFTFIDVSSLKEFVRADFEFEIATLGASK